MLLALGGKYGVSDISISVSKLLNPYYMLPFLLNSDPHLCHTLSKQLSCKESYGKNKHS